MKSFKNFIQNKVITEANKGEEKIYFKFIKCF